MSLLKKEKKPLYDHEKLQPAARKSYCNREIAFGFIDRGTGKFREYGCANSQRELEELCKKYGIDEKDLKIFY